MRSFASEFFQKSIMFLRFICAVACVSSLSLFIAESYPIVWIYHSLFIQSHSVCSHFSVVINNNNCYEHWHTSLCVNICFHVKSRISRLYGKSVFNFFRNCQIAF